MPLKAHCKELNLVINVIELPPEPENFTWLCLDCGKELSLCFEEEAGYFFEHKELTEEDKKYEDSLKKIKKNIKKIYSYFSFVYKMSSYRDFEIDKKEIAEIDINIDNIMGTIERIDGKFFSELFSSQELFKYEREEGKEIKWREIQIKSRESIQKEIEKLKKEMNI